MNDYKHLKVLIAHCEQETRDMMAETFQYMEYDVIERCTNSAMLVASALKQKPDLICTGVDMPDFDGVTALVEISRSLAIPSIIVTPKRSIEIVERALKDHVMAYLIEPFDPAEMKPTVYLVLKRFEEFQSLHEEIDDLKEALEKRKLVERAKGVLMRRGDLGEEEAYRRLQRMASDHRIKLIDAARQVLAVNDVMETQ